MDEDRCRSYLEMRAKQIYFIAEDFRGYIFRKKTADNLFSGKLPKYFLENVTEGPFFVMESLIY